MHDPHECHRRAEALATLAEMFPEDAVRYRARERHWRNLEMQAAERKRRQGTISPGPDSSVEGSPT